MGQCRYCGSKAGFFSTQHEACWKQAEAKRADMKSIIADALTNGSTYAVVQPILEQAMAESFLSPSEIRTELLSAANKTCKELATAAPLSYDEYGRIVDILNGISSDRPMLEIKERSWFGLISVDLSNIIYQVLEGNLSSYDCDGRMAFQLHRGEVPVFSSGDTILATYQTLSQRKTYQSIGVPIGAGMYYRIGQSHGPAAQTGLVQSDEGEMLFTSQALYFGGRQSTFRVPYSSILRTEAFVDGFGVFENVGKGKVFIPQYSGMEVGWFFYNLLVACMKLDI